MVFAEDIRRTILKLAEERGTGFSPRDVAISVSGKSAAELMEQVYFVASVLIKEGKIKSLRNDSTEETPVYIKKN